MHTADRQKMLNAQLLKQLILLVRQVCTAAKHHRADQSAVLLRQQQADFLRTRSLRRPGRVVTEKRDGS